MCLVTYFSAVGLVRPTIGEVPRTVYEYLHVHVHALHGNIIHS